MEHVRCAGMDSWETYISGDEGKGFEGVTSRCDLNAEEEAVGGAGAGGLKLGRDLPC